MDEMPLWMPKGSVRAIVAIGSLALVAYQVIATGTVNEAVSALTGVVWVYYFKMREQV